MEAEKSKIRLFKNVTSNCTVVPVTQINYNFKFQSFECVGEDVCVILCEPTLVEVVGLLDSLATLCSKDSPTDLVTLAFNRLKDGSSTSPQPPSEMWFVDTKLPIIVDCYTDVAPLLENVSMEEKASSNGSFKNEASAGSPGSSAKTGCLGENKGSAGRSTKPKARACNSLYKAKASSRRVCKAKSVKLVPNKNMARSDDLHKMNSGSEACLDSKTEPAENGKECGTREEELASPPQPCANIEVRFQ